LVAQQPEEMTPKDPFKFAYSDDDWLATYVESSPQTLSSLSDPCQLTCSHPILLRFSPCSSDEARVGVNDNGNGGALTETGVTLI